MSKRSKPAKKPSTLKVAKLRNVHACNPIMRKGGVHEKSNSAKRSAAKAATRKSVGAALSGSSFLYCLLLLLHR